jgi:periplasmic divalent cation tolerance protein
MLLIHTTTPTRDEALRLARELVEQGLVACAQLSDIESVYLWQGALQQGPECRLLLKTSDDKWPEVERFIQERHSYEVPAIFAVPVTQASEGYANWVTETTRGA